MSRLRRYYHSLRTALLVLLAFGLMVTPVLDQLGELHGVEHAAMAAASHGHAHALDLVAADHPHGDEGDSDHSDGSHGLLHLYTSVTVALPDTVVRLFPPPAVGALLPIPVAPLLPGDPSSLPFRPPIV